MEVVKRDINTSVLWGTIACRLSRVPGCWRRPRQKDTEEQDFIQEEGWCQESSIWAPIGWLCTVAVADIRDGQGGVIVVVVVQLLRHVSLFVIPWSVASQAPLSIGFPRQEYWSGLPSSSIGMGCDEGH